MRNPNADWLSWLITADGIFVDFSILHYDNKIVGRVLDQLDVGDWISLDQQKVGECSFFDHS
jgi:hypothetical protein